MNEKRVARSKSLSPAASLVSLSTFTHPRRTIEKRWSDGRKQSPKDWHRIRKQRKEKDKVGGQDTKEITDRIGAKLNADRGIRRPNRMWNR
ncbi:unnamed protein product [Bursaphelenchus xylophilus]|uniref:(pine wood nematode) hypothetical protein n=1 Tax=Bursaphelenchus xylophilus TaxID=6326 RepID=A0A1I7RLH2_BURXY|nr:unnamed protein product [Bursaphelenchus xylophilus]CAG9082989.1 unnamed protein product [Bursaphelenchus xylophilus]